MSRFDPSALDWRSMDTAPNDGSIFLVAFHPWNEEDKPLRAQLAQWDRDLGMFIDPCDPATVPYAIGWLRLDELFVDGAFA